MPQAALTSGHAGGAPPDKEEHMKSARVAMVLLLSVALVSAGCEEGGGFPGGTTGKGAVLGGLLGAGTGAIIGSQTGNVGAGTAIGAGIGTLAGGLVGYALSRQEKQLKRIEAESYQRDQELQDMVVRRNAQTQGLVVSLAGDFLFDTDSSTLKPGAYEKLNKIAAVMNDDQGTGIVVKGHTDNRGSESYNIQLSQRRAEAVKNALVQAGVNPARIQAVGYGESQPLVSEETPAAWQQNRRVTIDILPPSQGGGAPAPAQTAPPPGGGQAPY